MNGEMPIVPPGLGGVALVAYGVAVLGLTKEDAEQAARTVIVSGMMVPPYDELVGLLKDAAQILRLNRPDGDGFPGGQT